MTRNLLENEPDVMAFLDRHDCKKCLDHFTQLNNLLFAVNSPFLFPNYEGFLLDKKQCLLSIVFTNFVDQLQLEIQVCFL